jgi:hypothetical protein
MKIVLPPPSREAARAAVMPWYGGTRAKQATVLPTWFVRIRAACGAFEWLTLGYLSLLNLLILYFREHLAHPARYVWAHQGASAGILLLAWAAGRWSHPALRFARHWYPLPLYIGLFEELGGLVHLIFPYWFDSVMIRFDYAFAGTHPSVWMAKFANPPLNDAMQAAYMTYFLFLVMLPALLYAEGKRRAFWTIMVSTAVAHYTVYLISILLPVESPYYSLAALQTVRLDGGAATGLINWIERFGRVHGAAFPSAHVAGSCVAILASWRYRRWLFWACMPFFVGMMVATVYGRYHYVADVWAGLATGVWGFAAGEWLMRRRGALPKECVPH